MNSCQRTPIDLRGRAVGKKHAAVKDLTTTCHQALMNEGSRLAGRLVSCDAIMKR